MNYANIPDDLLDYPYLYESEDYRTLREELECIGEDLILARFNITIDQNGVQTLDNFIAWSDDSVIVLNYTLFNDKYLMKVQRNP